MATAIKNDNAVGSRIMSRDHLDRITLNDIARTCNVESNAIVDVYACTPVQLGIMADSMKERGAYIFRLTIAIAPRIDLDQYCDAVKAVVARESILRTRIVDCAHGIVQVVLQESHQTFRAPSDLTYEQYLEQDQRRSMGLGEPLLRTAIVGRRLVIAIHHVIGDGLSTVAMFEDATQIYHGHTPSPRVPFKDFVRNHYSIIDTMTANKFWAARLQGRSTPFPQLPSDSYLPTPTQKMTKIVLMAKPPSLALLPSYIETAWAVTAWNYTGETAVSYGMVLSGRTPTAEGLATTMGPTIETIPVCVALDPTESVKDLLKVRARERRQLQSNSAMRYGLNAIRSINEETRLACQFQTLLNIMLSGEIGVSSKELTLEARGGAEAPFALGLNMFLTDRQRIVIEASSDPNIIDGQQLQRVLNQFEHNLTSLTRMNQESLLSQLRWLNPHDRVELLAWNEHIDEYLQQCLHEKFRGRARQWPERSAIEAHDGRASYAQLDHMTDLVAVDLQQRGVEVGTPIVFMFDKSFWTIVAVVSTLKAGGVCVPIDTAMPRERKEAIVTLSKARLILTSSQLCEENGFLSGTEMLVLDGSYLSDLSKSNTSITKVDVAAHDLAYLQFTSGSTGVPKGVQLDHGNLVSGISTHAKLMGWEGEFRVLQFAAHAWDVCALEIWASLMFGGTICIPSEDVRMSNLAGFITANDVHWTLLTPTVIRTLAPSDVPTLRTLVSGGELIDPKSATTWGASKCFINIWCPCESGWNMTVAQLTPKSRYIDTIGRPIGCAVWLTRPGNCDELVPIGSVGELIIEGSGVARGYSDQPDQTAASFISTPSWAPPRSDMIAKGRRFYRTGDFARYYPDGSLVFVGRQDNQVKIRGQRFELGDVEISIAACAAVRNVFAGVQAPSPDQKRLIAVVSLAGETRPSTHILRLLTGPDRDWAIQEIGNVCQGLQAKLPSYMLPSVWFVVERLPSAATSKLDRGRIRQWLRDNEPELSAAAINTNQLFAGSGSLTPAKTDNEKLLQSVWSSVLGLPEKSIGRESLFIQLGGDSILAMQAASRCLKQGFGLMTRVLLRNVSLAVAAAEHMVPLCELSQKDKQTGNLENHEQIMESSMLGVSGLVAAFGTTSIKTVLDELNLDESQVHSAYPCLPLQNGILMSQLKSSGHEYLNRFAFRISHDSGQKDSDMLEQMIQAWQAICDSQPVFRTIFTARVASEGGFFQIVLRHINVREEYIQLEKKALAQDTDIVERLKMQVRPTFRAGQVPHRLTLFKSSDQSLYGLLDISHAIIDAKTIDIVRVDLLRAFSNPSPLVCRPTLASYVAWMRQHQQSSREYWRSRLKGARPCIVKSQFTSHHVDPQSLEPQRQSKIPFDDFDELSSFCKDRGYTISNVVLFAWATTLKLVTGAESPCFGFTYSGRDIVAGAESTMGPLLSLLVSRVTLIPNKTISALLRMASESTADDMAHPACSLADISQFLGLGTAALFNTLISVVHLWDDKTETQSDYNIEHVYFEDPNEYSLGLKVGYSKDTLNTWIEYRPASIPDSLASHIVRTMTAVLKSILIGGAEQTLSELIIVTNSQMQTPAPYSLLQNSDVTHLKKAAASQCELPKSYIEDILPCTSEQTRCMSHTTSRGASPAWRVLVIKASADLQLDRLCEALNMTESLVTTLRTRIVFLDKIGACQIIHRPGASWVEEDSLKEHLEGNAEISVRYGGPLCRFVRIEPEDGPSYATLSMHPAVCDERTSKLVADVIAKVCSGSKVAPLESLHRFVDYSMHRRTRNDIDSQRKPEGAAMWPFPAVSAHTSGQLYSTKVVIKPPCKPLESNLEALLQAAWALCLAYRTGSSKVAFMFDVNEADLLMVPRFESASGPTSVRAACTIDLPLTNLVHQDLISLVSQAVKKAAWVACFRDEDVSLDNYGRDEFLSTKLNIVATTAADKSWDKIETCLIPEGEFVDSPIVIKCNLNGDVIVVEATTRGIPSYHTTSLLKQYEHFILQLISYDIKTPLFDVGPLCESERNQLQKWNQQMPVAADVLVHEQFQHVVEQHSLRPAICAWDYKDVSYAQLDRLSSSVAQLLANNGVHTETIVPFLCEKSALVPIIMLGILKAGGALLPLDATHPIDRLVSIVQDCAAPVILTSASKRSVADRLPTPSIMLDINTLDKGETSFIADNSQLATPSNTCYVVYTSGSTGKPKGIVVTHRNAATFFRDFQNRFGITSETRTLHVLNLIFDASIGSMLCTLMHGGAVCFPSEEQLADDMGAAFKYFNANFANMTPTQSLLLRPEDVAGTLRDLALGGEPLPKKVVETWATKVRLINVYGPSETTVWSSSRNVTADGENADPRNIGHAAGCRYWVVHPEDHDRLVPIGCPGELLIEGPLVARGYLNDAQRTTTVFLDRPPLWTKQFPSLKFEERFYKSGDLVAQEPLDGSVLYLDRKDTQIKLRGQRIELGEIEHHLVRLIDDARWTVVVELVQPSGQDLTKAYLAVFYVLPVQTLMKTQPSLDADVQFPQPMSVEMTELRQKALAVLPAYMVPDIYYRLHQIPRTASGKTDRKALKLMAQNLTSEEVAAHHVGHTGNTTQQSQSRMDKQIDTKGEVMGLSQNEIHLQTILKSLWSSVLPIDADSISQQESFFRLGGNSATAIQLVAAARDEGYSISVAQIFRNEYLQDQAKIMRPLTSRDNVDRTIEPFSVLANHVEVDGLKSRAASLCQVEEDQVEDMFPCTPLQEGLVAMSYQRPGNYVAQVIIELADAIDTDLLIQAWHNTICQMPILRTCIVDLGAEGLVHVVLKPQQEDSVLQHTSIESASSAVASQFQTILGSKLNRMSLVQSSDGQSPRCLVWAAHHATYDGWTLTQIFQALEGAYYGIRQTLWTPFQSFVTYSRKVTQSELSRNFWRSQFSGMLAEPFPLLPSLAYRPRADSTLEYRIAQFEDPDSGFTKATAIRAAWAVVQASYSNATEVLFGAVVSGRQATVTGIERVAGPTIATVPLRLAIDLKSTADELLYTVQQQALDMIEHEQMGLQNIQRLTPEAAEACHFQTLLLIQPDQPMESATSGLYRKLQSRTASDADAFKSFSQYALLLVCQQHGDSLDLQFIFDSNVVRRDLVSRMSRQLESVLGLIRHAGLQLVGDIMHAGTHDLKDIWQWNARVPPLVESNTHDLIGRTMTNHPFAPAVTAWDGDLTYRELDVLSYRLALHLKSIGVGRETIVPLCFEKSIWMPVATLAVMRAGGVCIAMDVSLPRDRLLAISSQVDRAAILTSPLQRELASTIADGAPLVVIDQSFCGTLPELSEPQQELPVVAAANRLYICFTSGSTGVPKGVVITHGNFSSALEHQAPNIGLTTKSRVFDFASYSVDMSWYNLLHTLYAGACLCIPSQDERLHDISGAIQRLRANWICATPTVASIIDDRALMYLQKMELFGELGNADLFARLKTDSKRRIRSAYGPTECTGLCTGTVDAENHANIGRGVGAVTWIVGGRDDISYLAPVGGIGELWIEGPLVASEYFQNAEKTAAAFIEDPTWLFAGSMAHAGRRGRLYRTGDLVRYNEDGTITFLGRNDGQVKIRGQRVELTEVEHHLRMALEDLRLSTADIQTDGVIVDIITPQNVDKKVLAAFIVPRGANTLTQAALSDTVSKMAAELHPRLQQVLPRYMLPDVYIPLRSMPPASNSKRDRRKLQQLGAAYDIKEQQSKEIVGPVGPTEAALCQIWSDVLRCPVHEISTEGTFFELGGDSVSAMRIASRCRQIEFYISMDQLLRLTTIKRIAAAINLQKTLPAVEVKAETTLSSAVNGNDDGSTLFGLSPIQQFYFDVEHSETEKTGFVIVRLLSIPDTISKRSIENALYRLVSRHDMLRARFENNKRLSKWSQSISIGTTDSLLIRHINVKTDDDFDSSMVSCIDSLDIENGPLVSAVIGAKGESHLLFLAIHHIAVDLASMQTLVEEFEMILTQKTLPPPPPSFLPWTMSEAEYARAHLAPNIALPSVSLQPLQLQYWNLTQDSIRFRRYNESVFRLDSELSKAILGRCNRVLGSHPIDLITAALMHSFHRAFPDRNVPPCYVVGLGRETCKPYRDGQHPDMSNAIGWFSNMSPVQISTSSCAKLGTVVDEAKAHATRTLPNRGAAYFLSKYYHPEGRQAFGNGTTSEGVSRTDPYEVQLNYQAGFSSQVDDDDKSLLSSSVTHTDGKKPNRKIQELPVPSSLETVMATRFIPWSVFSITVPPITTTRDGQMRLKFKFEYVTGPEVALRWIKYFEESLREIEDLCSAVKTTNGFQNGHVHE